MKIITTIEEMREYSRKAKQEGQTIGFVPTMGCLHEGHLSLVQVAMEECDSVVMSIFINPTQFALGEDFEKYPRDMERDRRLAEKAGVDAIFVPESEEMYPDEYVTYVEVTGRFVESLCGSFRPGHFRGVTTVVMKLLNIVAPDKSYFGQKDAQQVIVIKRMVKDLNLPGQIRVIPIVREQDGLAMSSRNTYLSEEERSQAIGLFHSLERVKELVKGGESSVKKLKHEIKNILKKGKNVMIEYVEIVDAENLEPIETIKNNTLVAIAVFVGKTRLIDNVVLQLAS